MPAWVIALIVVAGVILLGSALSNVLPDRLRKVDSKTADDIDQMRATILNPTALPMHDHGFDRPR
ncbi:MAG TPA: hypothetical protein VME70_08170 [Mycobacteriales bacterium]|nr:hypothetical protein [Mycobacteriales bacterium]